MSARIGFSRLLAVGLALAGLLALGALHSSTASAVVCENSWTNAKGGSWFTAEDWSKKAVPTSSESVCIGEAGTYTVEMNETSPVTVRTLSVGGASGTQTLDVASTCSLNAVLTLTSGMTIGANGAVTMTNGDGCGNGVTIAGSILNAGTLTTLPAHGGERSLQGSLTNRGTVAIETHTAFNGTGAVLTNEGPLDLAEGEELVVTGENSVTNQTGGKIAATGNGALVLQGGGTAFTEGAGTTSGSRPVIEEDGSLTYSGAGEGPISLRGNGSLHGASAKGQALSIESTCGKHAAVTAPAGFSNGGSITFTNGDGCGSNTGLTVSGGSLSSSGTITFAQAHGGERTIAGELSNSGTIAVDTTARFNGSKDTLTNDGAIEVAEGDQLQVSNGSGVINGSGGSIAGVSGANVLLTGGGSFAEGAGTTTGTQPVIVEDGTLSYTGAGKSAISLRGASSLTGTLSSGQALALQSTCGKHAVIAVPSSVVNGGAVTMTNGDGCGNNVTVNVAEGATLSSSGSLTSEASHGGSRTITGRLVNSGTFAVDTKTVVGGGGSSLANKGSLTVAEGVSLEVNGGAGAANEAGTITGTGNGALVQTGGKFVQGAGAESGTEPVIVEDATLEYTGAGAGTIALRGNSTLAGNLASGQSLALQSTCGKHAVVAVPASLTNGGAVTFTNGDGCGNNVTLNVGSGATLTNSGSLTTEPLHGGSRSITGELDNTGTLTIDTTTGISGSGSLLLNDGSVSIAAGSTLSLGSGASTTNEGGTITGVGSGALVESGGTFREGAGKTAGTQPAVLEDGTLEYAGTGTGPIALRGNSTVSGSVLVKGVTTFPAKGQTLALQSTCSKHAVITVASSFAVAGTITMANGDGCGNNVTLDVAGTLTDKGTIKAERTSGGNRTIQATLDNEKTLSVGAGQTLGLEGAYKQTSKGTYAVGIASGPSAGLLSITQPAQIAGTLSVVQAKGLTASEGQKATILTTPELTGTFAKVKGNKVKKSKPPVKFNPSYTAGAVTLTVGP